MALEEQVKIIEGKILFSKEEIKYLWELGKEDIENTLESEVISKYNSSGWGGINKKKI